MTKELNDLVVFDFKSKCFSCSSDAQEEHSNTQEMSPEPKTASMKKQKTFAAGSLNRSMTKKSEKANESALPKNLQSAKKGGTDNEETKPRLNSPTSVRLQNTFIIKNADESFDVNSKLLNRSKTKREQMQDVGVKYTNLVEGCRPSPRDGHSAVVDSCGFMYIFGGDRHLMPFNDLYMVRLSN